MRIKIPHYLIASISFGIFTLISCSTPASVVKVQPGARGITVNTFPQDFHGFFFNFYFFPEKYSSFMLLDNDFISIHRMKHDVTDTNLNIEDGNEFALARFNGESLDPKWSVPILLDPNEAIFAIRPNGKDVTVLTVWNEAFNEVGSKFYRIDKEMYDVKFKIKSFDIETGASTIAKDIIRIPEFPNDYKLTYDTAGTKILISVYDTDQTSGEASIFVLDNFTLVKSTTIPFSTSSLPPKIDKYGNVYCVTAFFDKNDDEKIHAKAIKYELGGATKELVVEVPKVNIRGDIVFFRTNIVKIENETLSVIGERSRNDLTRGYTFLKFNFSTDKADAMNVLLTEDQLEEFTGTDDITLFPLIESYTLPNNLTLLALQGEDFLKDRTVFIEDMVTAQWSVYVHQPGFIPYGGGLFIAIDEKGIIKWHQKFDREIFKPHPWETGQFQLLPLLIEKNLFVIGRDHNKEQGIVMHKINTENGSSKEISLPFTMSNDGKGVYFLRNKSMTTSDGNIILFTKDGLNDTTGKVIKLNIRTIN